MSPTPIPSPPIDWIANIDPYFKFFTATIAGLAALFGLPVAFLQIRKTIAEIKKIELETKQIQNKGTSATPQFSGYEINVKNSDRAFIQITADPRFLGPLLLMVDFIIALIIVTLFNYANNIFHISILGDILSLAVYLLLFYPILREAYQIKRSFKSELKQMHTEDKSEAQKKEKQK